VASAGARSGVRIAARRKLPRVALQDRPATTVEEARQVLLDYQEEQGGIPTLPAMVDTEETETGWAFAT
jgi:hypothetical protein